MKTYCLRSHKGHILFNNAASHLVGLCALVLDPTHLGGGQFHCAEFPAGSLRAARRSLHGLCGFPEPSVSAPCPTQLFFPCHCRMGKSQLTLLVSAWECPPLPPADGCPSGCPTLCGRRPCKQISHHKARLGGCLPLRSGCSRGQRRIGAPGGGRDLGRGVRGSAW